MRIFRSISMLGAVIVLGLSGCAHRKDAKAFEKAFEGANGVNIELVKLHTETDGFAVFRNSSTGEYFAVNVDKFDRKNGMTYEQFASIAVPNVDIFRSLAQKSETRWNLETYTVWISTGGRYVYNDFSESWEWEETGYYDTRSRHVPYTYTWYEGGGFRFETGSGNSKDLESIAAAASDSSKQLLSEAISLRYGLSEERSLQLANLAVAWNKLEGSREMTDADKAVFSREALGSDFAKIERALRRKEAGDSVDYDALIRKAAQVNGTSPEHAERILTELFAE